VGIINAVNLIDGVDGYSSGYSIVSSSLFGVMFYHLSNERMVTLSAIVAASLLPFFLHNVFGKTSKMFIGDAGTLSLGIVFSMFVTTCLCDNPGTSAVPEGLGLVAFNLAVLCVPVFDTLRVMSARIWRGKSPFSPDKTHLHHLFIELGYSHIGAALSIICMNLTVVLCWYAAYRLGLSADMQLYVVIALGGLSTFVFYPFCKAQLRKDTALAGMLKRMGEMTHVERTGFWLLARKWADRSSDKE
jgi:UDP-N-acetylmuramyl pentapeptide phosphotransferase/UDP-N-acetylglucosamine-1-phosphate transferase